MGDSKPLFKRISERHSAGKSDLLRTVVSKNIRLAFCTMELEGDSALPLLRGVGPLAKEGPFDLCLLDGVGYSERWEEGQTIREVVIWKQDASKFYPEISLKPVPEKEDTCELTMTGFADPGTRIELTLVVRFKLDNFRIRHLVNNAETDGQTGEEVDSSTLAVWPEKVVRLGDVSGRWKYPVCPVRSDVWPYVAEHSLEGADADMPEWSVRFVGCSTTFSLKPGQDMWASVAETEESEGHNTKIVVPVPVAIWPGIGIPGWRSYSVLFGSLESQVTKLLSEETDKYGYHTRFWATPAGESVVRQPLEHRRHNDQVLQIEVPKALADDEWAPTFVSIDRNQEPSEDDSGTQQNVMAGGVFRLLPEKRLESSPTPSYRIGLDVGTTTTVAALSGSGGSPTAFDMMSVRSKPNVLCSNEQLDVGDGQPRKLVKSRFPWLPIVPNRLVASPDDELIEIPTGCFESANKTGKSYVPFCDYTFVCGAFDINRNPAESSRWRGQLKWNWFEGGEGEIWTRAFITSVLTWIVAGVRHDSRTFKVAATFPLAYSPDQRKGYLALLENACQDVEKMTGVSIAPDPSWTGDKKEPYCDESTALLGSIERYVDNLKSDVDADGGKGVLQPGFASAVFHADLGGGTLDLMLAAFNDAKSARILGAESIRFGGDLLYGPLMSQTNDLPNIDDEELETHVRRLVLARMVRRDEFDKCLRVSQEVQKRGAGGGNPAGIDITWKTDLVKSCTYYRAWCDIYAALLLEYCARFAVGCLADDLNVKFRLANGPGPGPVEEFNSGNGIALIIRRSGNGWKFLTKHGSGWDEKKWRSQLESRIMELASLPTLDGLQSLKIRVVWESKPTKKQLTAEGALDVKFEEQAQGDNWVPVECAPNGCDDKREEENGDWCTAVGEGSVLTDSANSGFGPSHRFFARNKHQVINPNLPRFPDFGDKGLETPDGARYWKNNWNFATGSDEYRRLLQPSQKRASEQKSFRVKSTLSALFEEIMNPIVGHKGEKS